MRESAPDREATTEALEAFGRTIAAHDRDHALSEPIPDAVADRLDQTLAYLAHTQSSQTAGPTVVPTRRRAVLLAAAAVAAVAISVPVVVTLVSDHAADNSRTVATGPDGSETADLVAGALGRPVAGPFADPVVRDRCLAANGVASETPILGSREVTLDGTAGTLFVLPSPDPTRMVALVVGAGCTTGNPDLISRADIG